MSETPFRSSLDWWWTDGSANRERVDSNQPGRDHHDLHSHSMQTFLKKVSATLREPTWWAWLVTGGLLLAGVLGSRSAFAAAALFALAQSAYFAASDDSRLPLSAQVRLAFALFLAATDAAGLLWLCWLPVAGTVVRLLFGYSLLGRMLSLLPWNRSEPFSRDMVRRTFVAPRWPVLNEKVSADFAARPTNCRDDAAVSLSLMPASAPARQAANRIERAVKEASRRRASIANAWRKRNSLSPAGLTDRQELDCAS
jgi:hypothetical protein